MKFSQGISIDACSCIFAALCLLMLPLQWNIAVLASCTVHEVCHLLAITACGISVTYLDVGIQGAEIGSGYLSPGQELFCAASGPIGSLWLLSFTHFFPEIALCGMVQGLFNLIPIYPFDGGRMLRCVLVRFDAKARRRIECAVFVATMLLVLLAVFGLLYLFSRWWIWIAGGYLLFLCRAFRKIPCKDDSRGVE